MKVKLATAWPAEIKKNLNSSIPWCHYVIDKVDIFQSFEEQSEQK